MMDQDDMGICLSLCLLVAAKRGMWGAILCAFKTHNWNT